MAGQPPFAVHISLTVSTKSVYLDFAERLLITEKQGYAVGSQQEGHLVEDALCQGPSPLTDVDRQEQFTLGLYGDPDPVRGARQALERLILADCARFEGTEY